MNKRLCIVGLLILTNLTLLSSGGYSTSYNNNSATNRIPVQNRTSGTGRINAFIESDPVETQSLLSQMNAAYARQETNEQRAEFINNILNNGTDHPSIKDKIEQIQAVAKVVESNISLRSGIFYNNAEEQPQIDWLYKQKTQISNRLAELQWQAKSFGEKTAWQTAKWTSIYLGIILAAYLSQHQLLKKSGEKYEPKNYRALALMPIEAVFDLAKNAATSETTQKAGQYIVDSVQGGLHTAAQGLTTITKPTPPTWWDKLSNVFVFPHESAQSHNSKIAQNLLIVSER